MIQVTGLMPEFRLLPLVAAEAVQNTGVVVLQSGKAGAAKEIMERAARVETLDAFFEEADDFDSLYRDGAGAVLKLAEKEDVLLCVIGDIYSNGFVLELMKRVELEILGGCYPLGHAVFCASAMLGDIGSYTVADARMLSGLHIDTALALVVKGIDDIYTASEAKLKLLEHYKPETKAVLVRGSGVELIEAGQLDRVQDFGDGAVLVLAALPLVRKSRFGFYDLVEIMKALRSKDGCPWDAEQTHKTLRQYLLEESYEVMDAIDADDMDALYDELGDVLLQVVFHSEIARQCGEFTDLDVTTAVSAKMINRHPHIFGSVKADSADEVVVNWEAIKREEKGNETLTSVLKDVPRTMGAMMRAYKIQKKAGAVGFDWENAEDAFQKVREETEELAAELAKEDADAIEGEAGDLLFAIINVLRKKKINPEVALTRTCEKFISRFAYIEEHAKQDLEGMSLEQMDALWSKAKQNR